MEENQRLQWAAFQELNKSLPELYSCSIDEKILSLVGYFAVIGGVASEYNILQLMSHVGININDSHEMELFKRKFSFYCGTGLIRIINNNLGLYHDFHDRGSQEFLDGRNTDVKIQREEIKKLKRELLERMNSGSEKDVQ